MTSAYIYNLCCGEAWDEAVGLGRYEGSDLDRTDGFIHFSTAAQVRETAAKHMSGVSGLVLLKVPVDAVEDALKWEKSRNDDLFPHLYRALRTDEVVQATPLDLDGNGDHVFPDLD